jgi:hypothetical protein
MVRIVDCALYSSAVVQERSRLGTAIARMKGV